MREIKFRAWDKKNKKFLKPYREQHIGNWVNKLSINMDGSLSFHEDDGFGGKSIGGESIEKRFEIMQYTGIKDKNGVEIYEGDIVKVNYNDVPEVKIITYHNASFGIRDNEMGFVPLAIFERPSKNLIVLGNIYENPELLEDK